MAEHFAYTILPPERWRRIKGTNAKGGEDKRPHFVPKTKRAGSFVSMDALGAMGSSGLCPGEILIEGEWKLGYRFVSISPDGIVRMLLDLDKEVNRLHE